MGDKENQEEECANSTDARGSPMLEISDDEDAADEVNELRLNSSRQDELLVKKVVPYANVYKEKERTSRKTRFFPFEQTMEKDDVGIGKMPLRPLSNMESSADKDFKDPPFSKSWSKQTG